MLINWRWGQREREDKFKIFGRATRRLELPLSKMEITGGTVL